MWRVRGLSRISLSYNVLPLFSADASIYVSFSPSYTVDQAGSVGDIKILQSPDKCFSDEVTRILESSPKWTPGRDEKGDAVKVSLVIPVDFRMTAEKPSGN